MSLPRFAVIGHPNKGKSSIVATLSENDSVRVSPVPGTTRTARSFRFEVDGAVLYELIDTPGFQRARELLGWLEAASTAGDGAAANRPALVARFVAEHESDPRFRDEVELLRPLLDGAGILYVVDGAVPYGREYELEMEVLRWTGRPRMALINQIGDGDFVGEWREALGQYFSIVREFNAVFADFNKRLELLEGFAALDDSWRAPLKQAVELLRSERAQREADAAAELARLLIDVLSYTEQRRLQEADESRERRTEFEVELTARLKQRIAEREQRSRRTIAELYRHFDLEETESDPARSLLGAELFTEESWQLFGLSRQQLLVTGAVSGAVAGSGVDLLLGGSSLLLGAGIGAALGGAGAWFGGDELAKVRLLGQQLGGRTLQVGPVADANFPWVILGRAWTHQHLVSERNHARREALAVDLGGSSHQLDRLPGTLRRRLARCFALLRKNGPDAEQESVLSELVLDVLKLDPMEAPS